jgi:hypothetical protein
MKIFSHEVAQRHWSNVDYRKNIMMRVFKKRYPNAAVYRQDGGEVGLQMDFAGAVDPPADPNTCA